MRILILMLMDWSIHLENYSLDNFYYNFLYISIFIYPNIILISNVTSPKSD